MVNSPLIRVYDKNLQYVGIVVDYESATFRRSWHSIGDFTIIINRNITGASYFQAGYIVAFSEDNNKTGIILDIDQSFSEDGTSSEMLTIKGKQAKYCLSWRNIEPPAGQAHYAITDAAETVLKNVVTTQASQLANDVNRRMPFGVAPSKELGGTYVFSERYTKTVAEAAEEISMSTGIGWSLELDIFSGIMSFDCPEPIDRTADQTVNKVAIFAPNIRTLKSGTVKNQTSQYKSLAIVGGQGDGTARVIRKVSFGSEPSGFDRREMFIDARDLETNADLDARGLQKLEEVSNIISAEGQPQQVSPLVYGVDYDLGDLCTFYAYGVRNDMRITEVTEGWGYAKYSISLTIGRPIKGISGQAQAIKTDTAKSIANLQGQ